jgi:ERCC4-type nuclease
VLNVIVDTREQKPLEFPDGCEITVAKLDTGDYSLKGYEDILCIERKGSLVEFYRNATQQRFIDELERMRPFKYKFLVLEFTYADIWAIPHSLNLPKTQWAQLKVKPQYIIKRVGDIQVEYGVHVIYAGDRDTATEMIVNIMKRVSENEGR